MKEKDERFCLGVGKEHRSVMEIPEAYQEALLARKWHLYRKSCGRISEKCFEEKPELAQFQEKFILQVPTDRADTVLRKMRNWYFEAAHQRVSLSASDSDGKQSAKNWIFLPRVGKTGKMSAPSAVP